MHLYDLKLIALHADEFITADAVKDLFGGSLDARLYKAEDLFVTDLFRRRVDQVGHDILGGSSKRVGEDAVQTQL